MLGAVGKPGFGRVYRRPEVFAWPGRGIGPGPTMRSIACVWPALGARRYRVNRTEGAGRPPTRSPARSISALRLARSPTDRRPGIACMHPSIVNGHRCAGRDAVKGVFGKHTRGCGWSTVPHRSGCLTPGPARADRQPGRLAAGVVSPVVSAASRRIKGFASIQGSSMCLR